MQLRNTRAALLIAIFFFVISFFLFALSSAYAAERTFSPLVGLPGITDSRNDTLPQYINRIYVMLISIGGLVAVVRLSILGAKYSLSDSVLHKVHLKEELQGIFSGLAILLVPFLVLNTINPELTSLDALKLDPRDKIKLTATSTSGNRGGVLTRAEQDVARTCTANQTYSRTPRPPQYLNGECLDPINTGAQAMQACITQSNQTNVYTPAGLCLPRVGNLLWPVEPINASTPQLSPSEINGRRRLCIDQGGVTVGSPATGCRTGDSSSNTIVQGPNNSSCSLENIRMIAGEQYCELQSSGDRGSCLGVTGSLYVDAGQDADGTSRSAKCYSPFTSL